MRTKKRAVRRNRSYKKSKKSYKKSKRGGATAPITFNIVKGNGLNPLFEVELSPYQTGNDLYDRVNQWLDQHPAYLTKDEKAGERKLVTDNGTEVTTDVILSAFQSPTTIILSINPRLGAGNADLEAQLAALRGGNRNPNSRTFTIVKGNSDDPVFKVKLRPNQSGKDLYDEVTRRLDRNLAYYLTDAERAGQRKLVTDNDVIVKYADNLSIFQPRTKLILSIIPEGSSQAHGRGRGPQGPERAAGA